MVEQVEKIELPRTQFVTKSDFADVIAISPLLIQDHDISALNSQKSLDQNSSGILGGMLRADTMVKNSWSRDKGSAKIENITTHLQAISKRYANTLSKMLFDEYVYSLSDINDGASGISRRDPSLVGPIEKSYKENILSAILENKEPNYEQFVASLKEYEAIVPDRNPEGKTIEERDPWKAHTEVLDRIVSLMKKPDASGTQAQWIQSMCSTMNRLNTMYHVGGRSIEHLMKVNPSPFVVSELNRLFLEKDLDAYGLNLNLVNSLVVSESSDTVKQLYAQVLAENHSSLTPALIRTTKEYHNSVISSLKHRYNQLKGENRAHFIYGFIEALMLAYRYDEPVRLEIDSVLNELKTEAFQEGILG